MKNVGMITFHESDNYGTVFQAFALQEIIDRLGYRPKIINYQRTDHYTSSKSSKFVHLKNALCEYSGRKFFYYKKSKDYFGSKKSKFSEFREAYLKRTTEIYSSFSELERTSRNYDAFTCGSDMIWSTDRADDIRVYFLDFVESRKRIAYAPSFGKSGVAVEFERQYSELLSKLGSISCRESGGVQLIKELTNKTDICHVLDPTLLIQGKEWIDMFDLKKTSEKYILCYLFENQYKEVEHLINEIRKQKDYKVLIIPMTTDDLLSNELELKTGIGPIEYLELFSNAELVFTNSYHGLMFSLIFNKSFFVVQRKKNDHWSQFQDRLVSALDVFDISNRIIDSETEIEDLEIDLNYSNINKIIVGKREESISYLSESLTKSVM